MKQSFPGLEGETIRLNKNQIEIWSSQNFSFSDRSSPYYPLLAYGVLLSHFHKVYGVPRPVKFLFSLLPSKKIVEKLNAYLLGCYLINIVVMDTAKHLQKTF